jgi:hypothetical protein
MAREAGLFENAQGDPLRGYILLKQNGGNIPPNWIDRARESRKRSHKSVARILKSGGVADITVLEEWDLAYRKECFYNGIRCLMELERNGRTPR